MTVKINLKSWIFCIYMWKALAPCSTVWPGYIKSNNVHLTHSGQNIKRKKEKKTKDRQMMEQKSQHKNLNIYSPLQEFSYTEMQQNDHKVAE